MQRIIYISTARRVLTPAERYGILAASRRNNAAVDVTGLLVMGGRRFLQALEGPDEAVDVTFRRIQQDDRHYALVSLSRQTITSRAFGNWAMGYRAGGDAADHASLTEIVANLVAPIEDETVRAYFTGFAEVHAAA